MSIHLLSLLRNPEPKAPTIRRPSTQEDNAMFMFANHAKFCERCKDPIQANLSAGVLCDLGNLFAWELAKYLYAEDGNAYSLLDRQRSHQRIQIEVSADCAVITRPFKAVNQGLTLGQSSLTHGLAALG